MQVAGEEAALLAGAKAGKGEVAGGGAAAGTASAEEQSEKQDSSAGQVSNTSAAEDKAVGEHYADSAATAVMPQVHTAACSDAMEFKRVIDCTFIC